MSGDKDIKKRIDILRKDLRYHNWRYYVLDDPEISDDEYDSMFNQLADLEKKHPEFYSADSPTQRVGADPLPGFKSFKHPVPMLSLSNVFSREDVVNFDSRVKKGLRRESVEYAVEPKFDGLAVELIYENGVLVNGSTRGDGFAGEEISSNLRTIKAVPLVLIDKFKKIPKRLTVRGEVIIRISDFKRLNQERLKGGEPVFANPRNAAAGSIRQLDPRITASRPLDIFFYALGEMDPNMVSSQTDFLSLLPNWGLKVNTLIRKCTNIEEVIAYHEEVLNKRDELDYDIDGVVVKVNSFSDQKELGEISRSPRWAAAYKFKGRQATTVIKDIIVQVGRTGALTPVAIMGPVDVGGVVVERATLHNQDEIDKKDVKIGDTVIIERAGDVIPYIVKVITAKRTGEERPFQIPDKCPVCGSEAIKDEGEAVTRCSGMYCPAKVKETIKHFASRRAMDIDGMGDKLVNQLVEKGFIKDVGDLYTLKKDDIAGLERMSDKSAQNIIDGIENSRQTTLSRFIYSLGIRNVGEHTAALLADRFGSIEALIKGSYDDLVDIKAIGPEIARSIVVFFEDAKNLGVIDKLLKGGILVSHNKNAEAAPFRGKSFVFTGTLESIGREDAKNMVEQLGGHAGSSVSKKTDFVVLGNDPGSKAAKAEKLGVKIVNEEEFIEMMNSLKK